MEKRIPYPKIASQYRCIYTPGADIYKGINTASFRNGQTYTDWIANDFTFIKKDEAWHAFGITHPKPPGFLDDYNYTGDVHEAEYQLFHCIYNGTLGALYDSGVMIEQEKILYPQQRLNELPDCWAPCAVERNGQYYLFYTPQSVRYAVSEDLYNWTPKGVLFEGVASHMRDPYVFFEDGIYTMVYIDNDLLYRTSEDLTNWSEAKIFQKNPFASSVAQESPCIWKRNGIYYLMWCIYDGQNGCYDNRSFVFASKNLYDFTGKTPLTMLPGHAPEIITDGGNYYIVSVFYPENGLNIARISWSDDD